MTDRTQRRTVHFGSSFTLKGVSAVQAAGDYAVDDDEELIEGLSWLAYRRVATFINLPANAANAYASQLVAVDPDELETALQQDREKHPD